MGYIKEYYEAIIRLQEDEWQFIAARFRERKYDRGAVITKAGQKEQFLSFIEKGMVRHYIPGDEQDITFCFGFDREFTCAYDSFITQTPATYEVQALTPLILWQISYGDLQQVYSCTRAGNHIGRYAAEQLFLSKSRRERYLLQFTATDRYLMLLEQEPHIIKQVPLKYIASYIGITPQALSRIRRRIT